MPLAKTETASDGLYLKRSGRIPLPVLGLVFLVILFLRHPAGILDANLWGEDGWVWYPDAYSMGFRCLLIPHTGYLQTISRLGGLVAQLVPLLWAPTVMAVIALVVQSMPPLLLLSRRFDIIWPSYWSRLLFAFVYIALPNSFETFGNLTNSQWYLAILSFLVVVSVTPRGLAGRITDSLALIISGLSGPFCLMLTPIAIWAWWQDRRADRLLRLAVTLGASAVQLSMLVQTMGQARPAGSLGVRLTPQSGPYRHHEDGLRPSAWISRARPACRFGLLEQQCPDRGHRCGDGGCAAFGMVAGRPIVPSLRDLRDAHHCGGFSQPGCLRLHRLDRPGGAQ
jgi:hypothetical protein